MNILIVSPTLPYPPDDGVRIRLYNLVKRISKEHYVALLALVSSVEETRYVAALSEYFATVETVIRTKRSRWKKILAILHGLLSGEPPESLLAFEKEMARKMQALFASQRFDIVQVENTFMARYLEMIPLGSRTKRIITIIDIGYRRYRRLFKNERRPLTKILHFANWLTMRNWEIRMLGAVEKGIAVSTLDKEFLECIDSNLDISVVENGVDVECYRPLPSNTAKKNILFLGIMSYSANVDAGQFFCSKILPLIKRRIPHCQFFIVGKDPTPALRSLSDGENVFVTGYVDDPIPFYQKCDIAAVPLRAGGGTRLKILEAAALGRPVVSTTIGCEGLDLIDGQHILIADRPEEFAEKTVRLLTDDLLYCRLAREARKLVETKYSWNSISQKLIDIYSRLDN